MIEPLSAMSCKGRVIALAVLTAISSPFLLFPPSAAVARAAESADRTSYVLLPAESRDSFMSGSIDDLRRAQALRARGEGLLYARYDGAAYVIRDPATLRRAQAIFEPQHALGERQAELGSRQAALGRRQAQLGAQQARLGSKQASASPSRADALGRQQDELGRQQDELGRQQDALGRQQDALGREQDRLGRVADEALRALLAEAIRSGVAQRVD